ncbi:MAG: membrane protein insertase YidC [Bdellovibrionales bacterium]|nr:membrane protein insertase YidC [Bdellovibrionales bacterium]
MDRRTLTVMVLTMVIFLGWQAYFAQPPVPAAPSTGQSTALTERGASAPTAVAPAKLGKEPARANLELPLSTGVVTLTNGPELISNWELAAYHSAHPRKADTRHDRVSLGDLVRNPAMELGFDAEEYLYLKSQFGTLEREGAGYLWTHDDSKVRILRRVHAPAGKPYLDFALSVTFKAPPPKFAFLSLHGQAVGDSAVDVDRRLMYSAGETVESIPVGEKIEVGKTADPVSWIATVDRYFAFAIVPDATKGPRAVAQSIGETDGLLSLIYPVEGSDVQISGRIFFGPKQVDLLTSVAPSLEQTVDFGWFTVFAYPLFKIMLWFYGFAKNYGVAIILLTLLVKLATFPLTYKSMVSMKKMAAINPQIQRLRERHKDEPQRLNQEMMALMKANGANPLAGCLPILIQMPVFFALYRVLYSSVELYQAPFFLWIGDLSAKDPAYVTPVLLTLTMYVQQKMTPATTADPMQQKMLQFMPVIFGVMMLNLPSGLTLYMLVNALAGIVQQVLMNRKLDPHGRAAAARA